MTGEYDINLSNGTVLSVLYPLETNGPDNRSTPRLVQNVRPQFPIETANSITNTFVVVGNFINYYRTGQEFEVVGSTGNDGTYTSLNSGFRVLSATIVGGGTGYTINDVLTIVGGTNSTPTTITVSSVNAGVIDGISLTDAGLYTIFPTDPVSVTGGTGSGATFNLTTDSNTSIEVASVVDATTDGNIITHAFVLNGDLTYRFIPTFSFDIQESSGPLLTSVDTGLETFTVAGDYSFYFLNGVTFNIVGSTGNDSTYTTISSLFGSGETVITVVENITDATIDGKIDGIINGAYTVTAIGSVVDGLTTIIPVTHGSIRDNLINSIGLPYGQIQYTISDTNTSLKLPGRGVLNYGELIIEDMVRITEHFANDIAPELNTNIGTNPTGAPITGQLWYKTLAGQEGFLHYDGSGWTNNYDLDNGSLILRDPQNTTTPNSDIYITGDETQLPVGYLGTDESGMVIWNEVDPIAQDAILRVMSVDGTENLRVEHDGYIRTANNLEVIGGGNGTTESYFHGQVGIGDNGLPTVERTLTVEGNGIAVNSDTGINAGLILDCPSVTEQSIVEFEVANTLISSIHTETDVRTVWESQAQLVDNTNVSTLVLRGGAASVGGIAGGIDITGGTCASGTGSGGNINLTVGDGLSGAADGIVTITGDTSITGNIGINVVSPTGNVDLEAAGDIKSGTVFLGGDGAITAPTYSFTNDPNSGMFSAVADQLGFVVNGTNVFNVEVDGTLSVNTAAYETLIIADNDIPNKKYVDDIIHPQYEEYLATGGEVIINTTIPTVANTGSPGLATLQVFVNGLFQMEGGTKSYAVTGATQITFNAALVAADDVVLYSFNK